MNTNLEQAERLLGRFVEHGDTLRVAKVQQIQSEKSGGGGLKIALCGHFSAGKSTLINRLIGVKLLPSSPLPTSANMVSIAHGPAHIEVVGANQMAVQSLSVEQLETICRDGETYREVRIFHPIPWLGETITLLDTPGIDSTDDAHALATHQALHVADVVLYVTDYNHVQSEVNFTFAKRLSDWGKPLFIVINQVDKHDETELAFREYDGRVRSAFKQWEIRPHGFFYISCKRPEHPLNQFELLRQVIIALGENADGLRASSMNALFRQLIDEHLEFVRANEETERQSLLAQLEGSPGLHALQEQLADALSQRDACAARWERRAEEWLRELRKLLENAPLTPASVRDLAGAYLQSMSGSFRSGFLFFGKNREQAQKERLAAFERAFLQQVDTQLLVHIETMFYRLLDEAHRSRILWQPVVERVRAHGLDGDWLRAQVKRGAVDSNEYLLNYSAAVAEAAKRQVRQRCEQVLEEIGADWQTELRQQVEQWQVTIDRIRLQVEQAERLRQLDADLQSLRARLLADVADGDEKRRLPLPEVPTPVMAVADEWSDNRQDNLAQSDTTSISLAQSDENSGDWARFLQTQDDLLHKLTQAMEWIAPFPNLADARARLQARREQLLNRTFTVALFGAFSAGKSSFANALMGAPVLPVSPNPTTAAINRIVPPTPDYPHQTMVAEMKTRERLQEDVLHALKLLGIECVDLEQARRLIPLARVADSDVAGRAQLAFLQAVCEGWEGSAPLLGQTISASSDRFAQFVANEQVSCFVEQIALYHDNPLTARGVVLVDTPGADSVNARHTHVTFEYLKQADVILFVTYYNHAFSQADRDFLRQLGRVKDRFQMDKMLFVINAADLADSRDEVRSVQEYVGEQLRSFAIHDPKLFALSSRQALAGKQTRDSQLLETSGLPAFESSFFQFIGDDLQAVIRHAAESDMRQVAETIGEWVGQAQRGEDERNLERVRVLDVRRTLQAEWHDYQATQAYAVIAREMQELVYYVKQRQQHEYGERFLRAFHPGRLRDDVPDLAQAMRAAWFELLDRYEQETVRELQALSLRLEQRMSGELMKNHGELVASALRQLPGFSASSETPNWMSPPPSQSFRMEMDLQKLARSYKSSRHFFAEHGRDRLRVDLQQQMITALNAYTDQVADLIFTHYAQQFSAAWARMLTRLMEQMNRHCDGIVAALDGQKELSLWQETHQHVQQLLSGKIAT